MVDNNHTEITNGVKMKNKLEYDIFFQILNEYDELRFSTESYENYKMDLGISIDTYMDLWYTLTDKELNTINNN